MHTEFNRPEMKMGVGEGIHDIKYRIDSNIFSLFCTCSLPLMSLAVLFKSVFLFSKIQNNVSRCSQEMFLYSKQIYIQNKCGYNQNKCFYTFKTT